VSKFKQQIDKIKPQFEKGGKYEKLQSVFDGFYTFLYTPNTTSRNGVHIHDGNDSKRTMIMVVLALMPMLPVWYVEHRLSARAGYWWRHHRRSSPCSSTAFGR